MLIYYFTHVTGTDAGMSGIPRLVKNLARELARRDDIELAPVCWSCKLGTMAHPEQKLLDNLARHGGPELRAAHPPHTPVEPLAGSWLLIPEAPHLASHDRDYPSLSIDALIGWARDSDVIVAAVLHDIMPLTHRIGGERGRAFVDMAGSGATDDGEIQRLRFAVYAHALALTDLLAPVSQTSQDLLTEWLVRHGWSAERLPTMRAVHPPEEILGVRRAIPGRGAGAMAGPKEFLAVGTVCAHKNQLAAMAAFLRLIERRPDLDLRLNVVGSMTAEAAVPASVMAKRSNGRIVLHGFLPDAEVEELAKRAHASVFVSLAEGYGTPAAESLWRGKPCLCSNEGSIAEIAAGGGCLTVDPNDLDAIESGFKTLATDARRYEGLLEEIASRRMRTWRDYADAVVQQLGEHAEEARESARRAKVSRQSEAWRSVPGKRSSRLSADGHDKSAAATQLFLSSSDLEVHPAYVSGRRHPVRRGGAICFDREIDGDVAEEALFYGPYVPLSAGVYAFAFDGGVDGELDIAFTDSGGTRRFADVRVASFAEPVIVELDEAIEKFEIVGRRTPSLKRLILRGAFVERRAPLGRKPSPAAKETGAANARRPSPAPVYGRDDDGRAVAFPCTIGADGLRVHDAYGAGERNVLRSNSTIAFRIKTHGRVGESCLFFGPYFRLEPGCYTIRLDGDLEGGLRLRLTQKFASETFLETVVKNFDEPIRLTLTSPAEKFEVIGDRTADTRSMTLRAIEITREANDGGAFAALSTSGAGARPSAQG